MNPLEIPTDNLYKFVAISGIVILLFSFIPRYHAHKLQLKSISLKSDIKILELDKTRFKYKYSEVENKINETGNKTVKLEQEVDDIFVKVKEKARDPNDLRKMNEETARKIKLIKEEWRQVENENSKLEEMIYEIKVRDTKISSERERIKCILKVVTIELYTGIGSFVCGLLMAVWGFRNWYTKLQIFQDELIKNKTSQGKNDASDQKGEK
ncbi:MAG: hypothetical protein A2173_02320 [Planctomycetes bacterium RBG_13_44_8b]|nr:MAG: hypothetical protein A2173_02320 [Planctomycetes bacterium RBG_13_44_8b]